jgi:flagellin FlaB
MDQLMRCIRRNKRGIVGIEAAIVLIAFVVIAAALAYVVINMGFYSAQKAKSTIDKGIEEATSALELDGFIVGYANNSVVQCLAIPLKLAVGQEQVDLASNTTLVAVFGTNFALSDIYENAISTTNENLTELMINVTNAPSAASYLFNDDGDTVLEQSEKAYMVVNFGDTYALTSYSKVKVEIRTSRGAALMIQREIPGGLPANNVFDLG